MHTRPENAHQSGGRTTPPTCSTAKGSCKRYRFYQKITQPRSLQGARLWGVRKYREGEEDPAGPRNNDRGLDVLLTELVTKKRYRTPERYRPSANHKYRKRTSQPGSAPNNAQRGANNGRSGGERRQEPPRPTPHFESTEYQRSAADIKSIGGGIGPACRRAAAIARGEVEVERVLSGYRGYRRVPVSESEVTSIAC